MSFTSDTQLREKGFEPMDFLPRRQGFRFIGLSRYNTEHDCHVSLLGHGEIIVGTYPPDLVGWRVA